MVNERIKLLGRLHNVIRNMNHEDAYALWIYVVPDEPTREDFAEIASNDADFKEVINLFKKIFDRYSKYE